MNSTTPVNLIAIDDDIQSLELITEALRDSEVEVTSFTDPGTALQSVWENTPDIVVLDLVMPGYDGMEMLARIVERSPETQVILLTGHYSTESAIEAIEKGACDYLTKPISLPDFRLRVDRLVREARDRRAATRSDQQLLDANRFEPGRRSTL